MTAEEPARRRLMQAIADGDAAAAEALLEGGADPRRANRSGSTPLRLAPLAGTA